MLSVLFTEIEKLEKEYVSFLQELIRTPSPVGCEGKCQQLVKEKMLSLGIFEKEVYPENKPPFIVTSSSYDGRPCIVGRIKGDGASTFILNAHIDTAPVEDESSWTYPPYSAEIIDDKLFGRGAQDDKAGVAIMLMLAEAFIRSRTRLPGDLVFESVIEDEDTGNGTLACTMAGYKADAAIVIDGTWPYRIIDAHLGQLWLDFTVQGIPAAACSCTRAINPIDLSFELILQIKQFINSLNDTETKWLNIDNPFFVCTSRVSSGVWSGASPETCKFSVQVGFPPSYSPQKMYDKLTALAADFRVSNSLSCIKVETGRLNTISYSNCDNAVTGILKEVIPEIIGDEMPVLNTAVTGHCDLRHFVNASGNNTSGVLYGPGGGGGAHVKDEYYMLPHFVPVAKTIAMAVHKWYA